MKEKNKSILKRLGIGALACFGVFAFAGCSSAEISKEQINTVIEENNKLTKEGAMDVVKLAITKLMYNQDNVLDNLKITTYNQEEVKMNLCYYKTNDGVKCYLESLFMGDGDYYTLMYDDIATVEKRDVVTCEWVDNYEYFTKTSTIYDEKNAFGSALLDTSIYRLFPMLLDLEQKDIIGYEMVDNNYVVTFFFNYTEEDGDRIERRYVELIINEDLLITNYVVKDCDFENGTYKSISENNAVFEYNTITDNNDILTYLAYVRNAALTPGV